uniref:Uncharacterized protein n=1 Tax=Hordeum vulgare subsp. vulgare TaxID=112509 RepID=A0A8I6XY66_HORVV
MVLISIPGGPRPVYDSEEMCEAEIASDPLVEKLNLVEKQNEYLKEKLKRIEEEKMKLGLYVVEVVDDHKIKTDAMRLKIRTIRNYALNKEAWFHYVVGSIVTLVAILIAFVVACK